MAQKEFSLVPKNTFMQIIEKLITEYSKSLSTNALVFQNNKKLKIGFNTVFILYVIAALVGSIKLLLLNYEMPLTFIYIAICTAIFLPVLQRIRNKAINNNFPKIKTSILKINHSEITEMISKNTEMFIAENRLENKLTEISELLSKKLEISKNQYFVLYTIIGATLAIFLGCFLTALFERLKDLSISVFIGVSILILLGIIGIGVLLFVLRNFLDDFTTEYQKISSIKNYIDDFRLKKIETL